MFFLMVFKDALLPSLEFQIMKKWRQQKRETQRYKEQCSKHQRKCQQSDSPSAVHHHPERPAAALAVMPAYESRITQQSLLNCCKHWQRHRGGERLSIVLNSLNSGISSSSSSSFLCCCVFAAIYFISLIQARLPSSSPPLPVCISHLQF